ncbi:MAG: hypothetical protein M3Z50_14660 [Actinomycetota bacterium]|nr:hypothetical protein [Actinomycetota bacterium]
MTGPLAWNTEYMSWEESVLSLFEDLEQQAAGLQLAEREAEVGERSVAEYAQVSLGSRLHASLGRALRVRLVGGRHLQGRLVSAGAEWLLLEDDHGSEWVLPSAGLSSVEGLSSRSVNEDAWPLPTRLSLRSVLRRIARGQADCVVHLRDDGQVSGRLGRIGRDFVEMHADGDRGTGTTAVPLEVVAAIQGRL